jgi:hypothetical protein
MSSPIGRSPHTRLNLAQALPILFFYIIANIWNETSMENLTELPPRTISKRRILSTKKTLPILFLYNNKYFQSFIIEKKKSGLIQAEKKYKI